MIYFLHCPPKVELSAKVLSGYHTDRTATFSVSARMSRYLSHLIEAKCLVVNPPTRPLLLFLLLLILMADHVPSLTFFLFVQDSYNSIQGRAYTNSEPRNHES